VIVLQRSKLEFVDRVACDAEEFVAHVFACPMVFWLKRKKG